MNEIERVARDHALKHCNFKEEADLSYWGSGRDREAVDALTKTITAAIAAMRGEPVAWMYQIDGGLDPYIYPDRRPTPRGWTETPLYAGPTPPASGMD